MKGGNRIRLNRINVRLSTPWKDALIPMETSAFKDWFNIKYNEWVRAQPGEEDFLAFCDLLGYAPAKVNEWLDGVSLPEGPEVLGIAISFGKEVYEILGLVEPEKELFEIFESFSHLPGEFRSRLTQAIWEVEIELKDRHLQADSKEAKEILKRILTKWGFQYS